MNSETVQENSISQIQTFRNENILWYKNSNLIYGQDASNHSTTSGEEACACCKKWGPREGTKVSSEGCIYSSQR